MQSIKDFMLDRFKQFEYLVTTSGVVNLEDINTFNGEVILRYKDGKINEITAKKYIFKLFGFAFSRDITKFKDSELINERSYTSI